MEPVSEDGHDEAALMEGQTESGASMGRMKLVMQEKPQECIDERFVATRARERVAKKVFGCRSPVEVWFLMERNDLSLEAWCVVCSLGRSLGDNIASALSASMAVVLYLSCCISMYHEGDAIGVELPREVSREFQVMRLHQPEMDESIGVTSREKDGSFDAFVTWEPVK